MEILEAWCDFQQAIIDAGDDPYLVECCQDWKPAITLTMMELLVSIQEWMNE